MREWWPYLRATYFTMDTRSLGAFRVAFGLVLVSDLARRAQELSLWYANTGLLPNHTLLWRPPATHQFSLFFGVSTVHEAQLGFALCAVVYAMFTFGYRTRLAQWLTLLARVSLNSRLAVLENGGDMVMDLLCLLTLALPLGARFSLDALMVPPRASPAEAENAAPPSRTSVVSVAVLGLLLQFAVIYFFNAISKNGTAWRDGTAVHYALHQDKLVTWLGVWMREHLPAPTLRVLTHSVLATEWLGCWLIITPVFVNQARALAVCLMPCLHLGFALGLNLGGFSPAMIAFFPLLLTASHWQWLSSRVGGPCRQLAAKLQQQVSRVSAWWRAPPAVPPSAMRRGLTESALVLLLLAIASEVLNDNASVPKVLRVPQPPWAKAIIEYPRILQGWRMFASEPPRQDSMIYVDATTAAGTRVDPYNEVASDHHQPAGDVVPPHMGQSQFFVMYSERIANAGYASYRQAFSEWLLAYPQRTGRAQDCLLSYDVYLVTDASPLPGTGAAPTPVSRQRFMTYRAPAGDDCRPQRPHGPALSDASGS